MSLPMKGEGKKLFKSDFLTDVTVQCGDQTWKLHKLMLVTRSEWFKKALCGPFEEAKSNTVVIRDHEPRLIGLVLRYLYTAEPAFDDLAWEDYLALYRIADFFLLDDLQQSIKDNFKEEVKSLVMTALDSYVVDQEASNDPVAINEEFGEFFETVTSAYELDLEWLKPLLHDFMVQTNYWMFCNKIFRSECKKIKEFYQEVVDAFIEHSTKPGWASEPPSFCAECGTDDFERDWEEIIKSGGAYSTVCEDCAIQRGDKQAR